MNRAGTTEPSGCPLCGGGIKAEIVAREMMLELGDEFHYLECSDCGCLVLKDPPRSIKRYYPKRYYAYAAPTLHNCSFLRRVWRKTRCFFVFECALGRVVAGRLKRVPGWYPWLLPCHVKRCNRILDIGCGNGDLLRQMHDEGFSDLTGIDPFCNAETTSVGIRIKRGGLEDLAGSRYDLVMLHHSLEHMPKQVDVLRTVAKALRDNGMALIRIPVKNHAWDVYREYWVSLDAPRHLCIHTERSIELAAGKAGLRLAAKRYDSSSFQFWGSEQYLRGISLTDPRSVQNGGRLFSFSEITKFEQMAQELNRQGRGDQAIFYFVKCGS